MTHEELQELLNTDLTHSHPDPAWDYYQLWENLHKIKGEIDNLLSYISPHENASEEVDKGIREKLFALLYSVEDLERTSL